MQLKNNRSIYVVFLCVITVLALMCNYKFLENIGWDNQTTTPLNEEFLHLKNSALVAIVNLTNPEINNTRHFRGDNITIEGKVFWPLPPPPPTNNRSNVNVSIMIDGVMDTNYNDKTDTFGDFQIEYEIPDTFEVDRTIRVDVNVTDNLGGDIKNSNFYLITINARSDVEITYTDSGLNVPGERFKVEGYVRYENGTALNNTQINPSWYNGSQTWSSDSIYSDIEGGFFSQDFTIPNNSISDSIDLTLTYPGSVSVASSSATVSSITLFTDISCNWTVGGNQTERGNITISGIIKSRTNPNLNISNRKFNVYYDDRFIDVVTTGSNGNFNIENYTLPTGYGNKSIEIRLVNTAGKTITNNYTIEIPAPPPDPIPANITAPPFLDFFVIFIPIVSGVIGVLVVYGFYYYRKQAKKSRVVNLPLEGRIKNLKILKDTGRIEESMAYLFNAIFMDLVNAKYGKIRQVTETIRDFAIVSVKDFNLKPDVIYPFTQKIEEIIYARPFELSERDFYDTCELFSPVYFLLTGYNFILNF